jgi:hypothetical protein
MEEITITCQCGRVLTALASYVGKTVRCPVCGANLVIPSPDQPHPTPAPVLNSQPETEHPPSNTRKPFPTKVVAISGGALALIAGIAIAAIVLFSGGDSRNPSSGTQGSGDGGSSLVGGYPPSKPPILKVTEIFLIEIEITE